MIQLPQLRHGPVRILYTFSVIIVFLVLMAVLWYVCASVFVQVQSVCVSAATSLDVTDSTYSLVDSFFGNFFNCFLILSSLGLMYWVYIYSQRKGERF